MIGLAVLLLGTWATAEDNPTCADVLAGRAPRAWITSVLDPGREAESVHLELGALNALTPTSPLDRQILARATTWSTAPFDPERIHRVDDRWWIYQTDRRGPRLFTADFAHEVRAPQAARELARRISRPQSTRVTARAIVTDVSIHRTAEGPVHLRRVTVDGVEHVARPEVHRGFGAFAPGVRALLESLGARSSYDETDARVLTEVPRVAHWPPALRGRGADFSRMSFREICLDPPGHLNLEARDDFFRDPVGRYVTALAAGEVPLIFERWEVDEPVRHALASFLLPGSIREWFKVAAERTLAWGRGATSESDHRRVRELQSLLMRHYEVLRLTLATTLELGRAPTFEAFLLESKFSRPVLLRRAHQRLLDGKLSDASELVDVLRAPVLADLDGEDPVDVPNRVELDTLRELHAEVTARMKLLF